MFNWASWFIRCCPGLLLSQNIRFFISFDIFTHFVIYSVYENIT